MISQELPPSAVSMEQLRDYCDFHINNGRGKQPAMVDQRGLGFLQPKHHANVALGIPPDGEMHDPATGRCFVRAVF